MRKAGCNYGLIIHEDKFIGISLGYDYCAEHEWGIKGIKRITGIPREHHAAIQEDINMVRELQKFAVDNLGRFGVDPESTNWKWYRFWDNWKKGLSNEDWNEVNHLMEAKQSIDKYLPKGTWKD